MEANFISALRSQIGLSQAELAARVGTSQPAIARLESGDTNPTIATLQRVCEALGHELVISTSPISPPDPIVELYKRDVDRSLLRENLRRTIDERLRMNAEFVTFGDALARAQRVAERPSP